MSHAAEKFLDAWCNSYPVTLFASVLKSVVARGDGEIVPGTSHRVWEMPAEQQGGFVVRQESATKEWAWGLRLKVGSRTAMWRS